ncbi:MAG: AMP-binding protein [Burkholderiales bacterium]|nr:AMP-binding protein [Burkholderiales bacterium]
MPVRGGRARRGDRMRFDRLVGEAAADAALQRLRREGVGGGAIVAWLGLNSLEMISTLVACRRLGAVLLPLNWRLAASELARLVGHAGAGHLLVDDAMAALGAQVAAQAELRPGPAAGIEPGDLLLVYTSGTGGQPKGALHTAAGMEANCAAAIEAQDFDAATRVLTVLPLFHVGGLCIQTLPVLAAGGSLRLHARFDPGAWFDDVEAWRPTTSLLVPAVMRALVEHPRWAAADLSSLAFVNSGSQIVPRPLIDAFHARGVPVAQVYGATETGPVSIVLRPEEAMAHPGSAGRPARGVEMQLGADGEIRLRAPQLMRGYHRSAERGFDDQGWFHSGDLARVDAEGYVEVVGRSRELIISGGENIHPAEIEQLVDIWPGVAECAVVAAPDPRWGEVPVLALVARGGAAVDVAGLRAMLEVRLARFKQPRRIVVVAALPRTALGKLQRAALAAQLEALPVG